MLRRAEPAGERDVTALPLDATWITEAWITEAWITEAWISTARITAGGIVARRAVGSHGEERQAAT